jgi:1,4-alpha-glucan branching enzyme
MRTWRRTSAALFAPLLFACGDSASSPPAPGLDAGADASASALTPDASAPRDAAADAPATADATPAPEGGSSPGVDASAPANAQGATVTPAGVQFRVWAPAATAARVTGDFTTTPIPMQPAPGGVFEVLAPSAHAGSTYQFSIDSSAGTVVRTDPYCRQPAGASCVVVDPSSYAWKSPPFTRPATSATVAYELHVGSFGASPGATTPDGTFATAAARLPALAALGVNAVELMPVHDFGGHNGWGYNPTLWLAPFADYGTSDDLRAFVDQAHALGIAVWIDVVYNHYDGGSADPLVCYDGTCAGSKAGAYFFPTGMYATTPWGPRPDYTVPEVAAMLEASVAQWTDEYRGDGFRFDSTSNIRGIDGSGTLPGGREFLVAATAGIRQRGAVSVAEDLKGYAAITAPSSGGGFGFDAQWDGFGYTVTSVLTQTSDSARSIASVAGALTGTYNGDPFERLLFTEDHDTVGNGGSRLPDKIDPSDPTSLFARERSVLGAVLLLTAPGIPMLFMGQESLATGTFAAPPQPLAAPTAQGAQIEAFYTAMIRLRRNLDGGSGGLSGAGIDVFHQNETAKVVAYRRHGASNEDVLVVMNLSNTAFTSYSVGAPSAGPWKVRLDTASTAYGADLPQGVTGSVTATAGAKDGEPFTLTVPLAPYSAVVMTL